MEQEWQRINREHPMPREKLPPRLYLDSSRKVWVIRYECYFKRTRFTEDQRDKAEAAFVETLKAAKPVHTFGEIADAAGLTRQGVRYFVNDENAKRRERKEAKQDG